MGDGQAVAELAARLDKDPDYRMLRISELESMEALVSADRYQRGDLIRVPRTGGHWSLGVVAGHTDEGLQIILRTEDGSVKFKELSRERVAETNRLKIGDVVQMDDNRFWIVGLDAEGDLVILTDDGDRVNPRELRDKIGQRMAARDQAATVQMSTRDIRRVRALHKSKTEEARLAAPRNRDSYLYLPLESIFEANTKMGLIAGNRETDTVFGIRSPIADAALHTDKGQNYKSYNEDAASLFADKQGRLYVGVFDQAGGEGSDEHDRGAASRVAAEILFAKMQEVARADGDDEALEAAMVAAVAESHRTILSRHKGEVSTFVGGRLHAGGVTILNVGDSGALLYDQAGALKERTEPQGFGRLLLEGVGMLRDGARLPKHEIYRWPTGAGDYIVFGSDGLFDSKLTLEEIGQIIVKAGDAPQATRALRDLISSRMKTKASKPDNLTILVVRARA